MGVDLTDGEQAVHEVLKTLDGWEVYPQPSVNGKHPDFVVLGPGIGLVFVEVKSGASSAAGPHARTFVNGTVQQVCEARARLAATESVITARGRGEVRTVVVFTDPAWQIDEAEGAEFTAICSGSEWAGQLLKVFDAVRLFPKTTRITSAIADDLRHWLVEPEFSKEQWRPVRLNEKQREIAFNPDGVRRRRIRGVAGSGKSEAIVARSVECVRAGADAVLVLCFNLTLVTYLRDRIRFHERTAGIDTGRITILHWHGWAKESLLRIPGGDQMWRDAWRESEGDKQRMAEIGNVVGEMLSNENLQFADRYDVILIDEAQDIPAKCVIAAARVLKSDGELVIAGDRAQDIYGTHESWTEQAYQGLGFRSWMELDASQRVAPRVARVVGLIEEGAIPGGIGRWDRATEQLAFDIIDPRLDWVDAAPDELAASAIAEASLLIHASRDTQAVAAWADLVIAASTLELVRDIAAGLRNQGFEVLDTYDKRDDRAKKSHFYKGRAAVKVTTINSIKGFSVTRYVLVFDGLLTQRPNWRKIVGTGLTRLTARETGCSMTVVNADPNLVSYGPLLKNTSD